MWMLSLDIRHYLPSPCDSLMHSNIHRHPQTVNYFHTLTNAGKELENYWGHIDMKTSLRRLTQRCLLRRGLPTNHSLLWVETVQPSHDKILSTEKSCPNISFLTSSLVFFLAHCLQSVPLGGSYNQMEKKNLIGGDEMKEKCLHSQF